MSAGSPSLSKSIRTMKVYPNPGNVAQTFRTFVHNSVCENAKSGFRVDPYGRPSSINGGLQIEGNAGSQGGIAGCLSPLYRIETENILRPQYGPYLNLPAGLMMTHSEYQNSPHYDTMIGSQSHGRDRPGVFGVDGMYKRMAYPSKATNPNSDKDNLEQEEWFANQMLGKFDSRLWLNSSETQSGF